MNSEINIKRRYTAVVFILLKPTRSAHLHKGRIAPLWNQQKNIVYSVHTKRP